MRKTLSMIPLEHKLDIPYNNTRVPSEPGVYRCNACDFVADNASELNRHR